MAKSPKAATTRSWSRKVFTTGTSAPPPAACPASPPDQEAATAMVLIAPNRTRRASQAAGVPSRGYASGTDIPIPLRQGVSGRR